MKKGDIVYYVFTKPHRTVIHELEFKYHVRALGSTKQLPGDSSVVAATKRLVDSDSASLNWAPKIGSEVDYSLQYIFEDFEIHKRTVIRNCF